MNFIKKKKKVLGNWYQYSITDEKGKEIYKIVGKNTQEKLKNNLTTLKYLVESIDKKTTENIEYENYLILNENHEVLIMDVVDISITDSNWLILELDNRSKNWKKIQKKKSDRIYCIIDNKGLIKVSPTNKIIKYIPCINKITVGNEVFKMHHSHDDYSDLKELIPGSTYIISKGNQKGLIYGQAFYDKKNKTWNSYANIGLFPLNYKIIEAYPTFFSELYVLKLDNKYTFYRAYTNQTGRLNELESKRFKHIKRIKNNFLNMYIGFLCFNEDDSLEFYRGYGDFEIMNTKNIDEAYKKINKIIESKYECDAGTEYKYPDFSGHY